MFLSCSQAQTKTKKTSTGKLLVYYFHSTDRCVTCNAVENNARALLEESYKTKIDNGTIKFASYNIDEEENKALVEKYQVAFSTLLIIKADGTKTDFTNTAFQYAKNNPKKYKELLNAEIKKQLGN
jgi:thiol-disulfide isomerase/thioredoxin